MRSEHDFANYCSAKLVARPQGGVVVVGNWTRDVPVVADLRLKWSRILEEKS